MDIKFDVHFPKNIGTLYKDNEIDTLGREGKVNLDLGQVNSLSVEFKVGDISFTDTVTIKNIEDGLIQIPFKTDVIKQGNNSFEIIAIMKNGDVKASQTYTYFIEKSLENENSLEAETNYPILIQLLSDVQGVKDAEVTRVANEEARQVLKDELLLLKTNLESLQSSLNSLDSTVIANENTRQSNEEARQTLNDSMSILKSNLESLQNDLNSLESSIEANESTRQNNESTRVANFNTKINEVNAKVTEVNNKIVEANTTIDNTNIAKNNTIVATTNANTKITETEATRQSIIATINNLVAQFNALAPENSTNAEVQLARTDLTGKTFASLQERLISADTEIKKIQRLEEATTSTISIDSSFVNIGDTSNGYLSDIKLEGRTLVNLLGSKGNCEVISDFTGANSIASVITTDKVFGNGCAKFVSTIVADYGYVKDVKLDSNKYYFLTGYAKKGSIHNGIAGSIRFLKSDYSILASSQFAPSLNWTRCGLKINPTKLAGNTDVRLLLTTSTTGTAIGDEFLVDGVQLVEISASEYNLTESELMSSYPYIEGLKSVGQDVNKIVVSSIGENLLDISKVYGNYGTSPKIINNTMLGGWQSSIFEGTLDVGTYTIKATSSKLLDMAVMIRLNNLITNQIIVTTSLLLNNSLSTYVTFTITTKDRYKINFDYQKQRDETFIISELCLNRGTSPIVYQNYQTDKKEISYIDTVDSTWKKPVFRGIWSNGSLVIGDTEEKSADGKYYYKKRMSEVTFNGSETGWALDSTGATNLKFRIAITGLKGNRSCLMSNIFSLTTNYTVDSGEGIHTSVGENPTTLYVEISKTKCTDLATFKTWLASNNITVVYPLSTELVYECTPIDLASYDSETHFVFESGVLSPRSTIKVQNFIGNIINTMKEKISLQENTNNFLMAMALDHEIRVSLIEGGM